MSYTGAMALLKRGIARPTLYNVSIPGVGAEANDQLNLFCKATTVPGVSLNTIAAAGQEFQGIVREQPTEVVYPKPFTISVICERDYIVYKAMRAWFDTTIQNANQVVGRNQRVNYYNTFVRDFTLTKLELPVRPVSSNEGPLSIDNYDKTFSINFINSYPVNIGSIQLGSDMFDGMVEFEVDFTYESFQFREDRDFIGR